MEEQEGEVILFYKYVHIEEPQLVQQWQKQLCQKLDVTGKIRISKEGINVTIGGSKGAIEEYKNQVTSHPLFQDIKIKCSPGGNDAFDGLKVSVVEEAIPIKIPLEVAPAEKAAPHLSPDEAHQLLSHPPKDLVILDARNYYESRIGHFNGAIMPNIRKFSSFPEYLQKNKETFQDKVVFMYCTGGIRCERGSAYLKSLNICKQIYQLEGGIHEYVNKYPNGYFRGKNYVFDKRMALPANSDVVSTCNYCESPYDNYGMCFRTNCCIVSLCCEDCKQKRGGVYYCCYVCQEMAENGGNPHPCLCTTERLKFNTAEEYYRHFKKLQ